MSSRAAGVRMHGFSHGGTAAPPLENYFRTTSRLDISFIFW
jgi:hypothetical protein